MPQQSFVTSTGRAPKGGEGAGRAIHPLSLPPHPGSLLTAVRYTAGMAFDVFGGVDFSGAREPLSNLWSALGVPRDGLLHVLDLRPHAFRADLMRFIADGCRPLCDVPDDARVLWGLDFPFSLPQPACEQLLGQTQPSWPDVLEWVATRPPNEVVSAASEFQKTARSVDVGRAMAPLDLRLHKQTLQGMRLLDELRRQPDTCVHPFDSDPARTTLLEVYPSITARDLGVTGRKPTKPAQALARRRKLEPFVRFAHPSMEACAATLEDAWDAVLACLTAYLVRDDLDQPWRVGRVPQGLVQLEGWIYRHPECE